MKSIGCIYHYYEADLEHQKNFQYFLKYGILQDVYYVIVLASEPNFELPILENVSFIRVANEFRDIGGYIKGYKEIRDIADWDYVFFINSGALGPLPIARFALEKERWTTPFIDLFSDNVQLVGTSVNTLPRPVPWSNVEELLVNSPFSKYFSPFIASHIQSFFFCIKKEARHFLDGLGFFDQNLEQEQTYLIVNFEIALSQIILNAHPRWKIRSNLDFFRDIDFKGLKQDPNFTSYNGDPYFRGTYFGETIDPNEAVFFKTTRSLLNTEELENLRNI